MHTLIISYLWRRPGRDDMLIEHKTLSDVAPEQLTPIKKKLADFTFKIRGKLESRTDDRERSITHQIIFLQGESNILTNKGATEFRQEFADIVDSFSPKR